MRNPLRPVPEPDDVYVALVSELFTGWLPAAIMGVTLMGIGLYVAIASGGSIVLATATALGGLLTVLKLGLMLALRRSDTTSCWDRSLAARWEAAHGLATVCFAAMVAIIATATFHSPNLALQMLATGMLFGYCSGVVARASVRPRLAMAAIATATLPVIVAAALCSDSAHWILAIVFTIYLGGSFESVRHVHGAASRQIAMRLDMATLARNDPLTGLANRLGLREAFRAMAGGRHEISMVAVHCFDLDRFKPVNDRYGHPAGDALLRMLAERVRAALRDGDVAARIGGDEFVVIQGPIRHAGEADIFARRLSRAITTPYDIEGSFIEIGVSLGYATSPPGAQDLEGLMATADAALYRMKDSGGGIARGGGAIAA